jgi:hypothetical protein
VAGSPDTPGSGRVGSTSWWSALLGRAGVRNDALPATAAAASPAMRSGELRLFLPAPRGEHAELFMSERTGDWIRVGCGCSLGVDHWHAAQAG